MNKEEIAFRGRMFELVQFPQPDGRVFEVARRAPGTRIIIADKQKHQVLLQREYRRELDGYDFRLPGGKVFDSLEEYETFRKTGEDILRPAVEKAKAEAYEEAGIAVDSLTFFRKSTLGATVEWDLYVFEATEWHEHEKGRALEAGEQIDVPTWFGYEEAEQMIINGELHEERIALILLQWLHAQQAA